MNIHNSSKKDIKLLNDKGSNIYDPKKIVDIFNLVGPNIDERIPKAHKHFIEYMGKLKVNKTIFLTPATSREIYDIISAFDIKKSLGPNSIPVYILKISNNFFSNKLTDIIKTGKFPCSVCLKGVGRNSILCPACKCWVHVCFAHFNHLLKNIGKLECVF